MSRPTTVVVRRSWPSRILTAAGAVVAAVVVLLAASCTPGRF